MSQSNPPLNPLGPPPPPPRRSRGMTVLLVLSFLTNVFFAVLICGFLVVTFLVGESAAESSTPLPEKLYAGDATGDDKIAIIKVEGVLLEGATSFAQRQIETAAKDKNVKAIVLQINSPGGSITASDDLHRRLIELRDGSIMRGTSGKKHLVVSMSSIAASGGYYIAMPGNPIYAEKTTITGSIGVYAALPNVAKLADTYGVKMEMIKRGDVKDSGSMFKVMTDEERQVWDDMVGHAYDQFIEVVETGRPKLTGKMLEDVVHEKRTVKVGEGLPKEFTYVRKRADGGIFTSDKALQYGLIDKVGYLDDAVDEARKLAGLPTNCKVVTYTVPFSLTDLLSIRAPQPAAQVDPAALSAAASPRLWYLAPGHELAGYLAASQEGK